MLAAKVLWRGRDDVRPMCPSASTSLLVSHACKYSSVALLRCCDECSDVGTSKAEPKAHPSTEGLSKSAKRRLARQKTARDRKLSPLHHLKVLRAITACLLISCEHSLMSVSISTAPKRSVGSDSVLLPCDTYVHLLSNCDTAFFTCHCMLVQSLLSQISTSSCCVDHMHNR